MERLLASCGGLWSTPSNPGTLLVDLLSDDKEYITVEEEMQNSIREHRDNGHAGGIFSRYNIVRVCGTISLCIQVYLSFFILFFRFRRFKIVNYGRDIIIDGRKWPKKITTKRARECYFMVHPLSMPLSRRVSTKGMPTSVVCLEREYILLNIPPKVISMFMVQVVELDVLHIRIEVVILVIGKHVPLCLLYVSLRVSNLRFSQSKIK